MKAKLRETTGAYFDVVEVNAILVKDSIPFVRYYADEEGTIYDEAVLEFLPEESKEVTIEGWLCKNEYEDGFARIHTEEPQSGLDEMPFTGEQLGIWRSNGNIYIISDELFPNLKWTDSPKKVKITITTPIEE